MSQFRKCYERWLYRLFSVFIVISFSFTFIVPPSIAQTIPTILNLPIPGSMVNTTASFAPALIKGVNIHPDNALKFDFIIDKGDVKFGDEEFRKESIKLIKYFLAALTVSEDQMWVNLSPYEKDRIVPQMFGQTEMGRDLLAQDYLLKQLTASLMNPEQDLGSDFWTRVHKQAKERFGTEEVPMNTFNKIWIVPEKAVIYEHEKGAFVVESHLKVMLDEDYMALEANKESIRHGLGNVQEKDLKIMSGVQSEVIKEILIPEIEKEVNEGKTFANLRQIYNSVILANWYKQALKESLLGKTYVNQGKTKGLENEDKEINQKIYDQYVAAFKKGVYDYIKEDYDPTTQEIVPRKYFSGGVDMAQLSTKKITNIINLIKKSTLGVTVSVTLLGSTPQNISAEEVAGSNRLNAPKYSLNFPVSKPFPQGLPRTPTEALPTFYGNAGIGGGIGTGSTSRTMDGRMTNIMFSASPVIESLPQGQTSVYVKIGNQVYATPLGVKLEGDTRLTSWNWETADSVANSATYHQSFPFASWTYPVGDNLPVELKLTQFSPLIPGDLDVSSEPVIVTEVEALNPTDQEVEVAFMVSVPNFVGYLLKQNKENKEAYDFVKKGEGQTSEVVENDGYTGLILDAKGEKDPRMEGQLALVTPRGTGLSVTYHTAFDAQSSGQEVWQPFSKTGELSNERLANTGKREQAGAIAVKFKLGAGERRTIPFSLSFDFPKDLRNKVELSRYHTKKYGTKGENAFKIATNALERREEWKTKINEWQRKVLDNPNLPDSLKSTLINELYFLVQGGSALTPDKKFYILESLVYRIHNTLDVWYYTPMLAYYFPELEKEIIKMHSDLIPKIDLTPTPYLNIFPPEYGFTSAEEQNRALEELKRIPHGKDFRFLTGEELEDAYKSGKTFDPNRRYIGTLKPEKGVVHHIDDLIFGDIVADNDFDGREKMEDASADGNRRWQNHNPWKDLNPKFVLMAWRAFYMDGQKDKEFLKSTWPSIKIVLDRQRMFDKDGDGLPEHEGFPDQTFDTWVMKGAGIMTADLTIAALQAAIKIGGIMGDTEIVNDYKAWLAKAKDSVQKKLWNGEYYNVHEGNNDIMADAFPGDLYLRLYGLSSVLPEQQIKAHLAKVYAYNFKRFGNGKIGIVNGIGANGQTKGEVGGDIQRDEVWIGVQRSVIASMLLVGMKKEAFEILEVDYKTTWAGGYANRTPEAIDVNGGFRAEGYMRAGATHFVLQALEMKNASDNKKADASDRAMLGRREVIKLIGVTSLATVFPFVRRSQANVASALAFSTIRDNVNYQKGYEWIKGQINSRGLIGSFVGLPQDDPSHEVTWIYNQGQAIQAFLAVGDIANAERLARGLINAPKNGRAWFNAYMTETGKVATKLPSEQKTSFVGANMAVGHALLNLLEVTNDPNLAEQLLFHAFELHDWLNSLYHDEGEYAYVTAKPESNQVWTEYNQRAFAFYYQLYNQFNDSKHKNKGALGKYRANLNIDQLKERADKIIRFIQEKMWAKDHYLVGYTDVTKKELAQEDFTDYATNDPKYWSRHAWGYPQYLGPIMAKIAGLDPKEFAGGLDWMLAHQSEVNINGKNYKGLPRWFGTPSLWAKGIGESVVALRSVGREKEAQDLLGTLAALQDESGSVLEAYGEENRKWPVNFPHLSIEGTASLLVAAGNFGPRFIAGLELVKTSRDAAMLGSKDLSVPVSRRNILKLAALLGTQLLLPESSSGQTLDPLISWLRSNIFDDGMPRSFRVSKNRAFWENIQGLDPISSIIERIIINDGLSLYDGATWQIALAAAGGQENIAAADVFTRTLLSGSWGELSDIRGYRSEHFSYQGKTLGSNEAAFFRLLSPRWKQTDPLTGKTNIEGYPSPDKNTIAWADWKPIIGENAWVMIGPLQVAYSKYGVKIPTSSDEVKLAVSVFPALQALTTEIGAILHAPEGTNGKNPDDVSNENNISAYAALKMLYQITKDGRYLDMMRGIEDYMKRYGYDKRIGNLVAGRGDRESGILYQGGLVKGKKFEPNVKEFAVDVQTWGLVSFTPAKIDEWYGEGAAYRMWAATKMRAGYFQDDKLLGVGYTDGHEILSVEWTAGAIGAALELALHYMNSKPDWAKEALQDAKSMTLGIETLSKTNGNSKGYLYANLTSAVQK